MHKRKGLTHSRWGDPGFISTTDGDYRVNENSEALTIGFVNFPMDSFGVVYPPLRSIAETPVLPEYLPREKSERIPDDTFEWNGVNLKSVTSEGERSATGIAEVKGVLVMSNNNPDIALQPNDVILKINGMATDTGADLRRELDKLRGTTAKVMRFRDQKPSVIKVRIP